MTRRRGDDGWGGIVDALLVLVLVLELELELEFLRLLMMREESRVSSENRVCFDLRHDRDLQRRGRVVVGSVQVHRQGQGLGAE